VCNRPSLDFDNWLGANAEVIWAGLADEYDFEDGAVTYLGVDVGIKRDSSAVASWQERPDGRWHVKCRLWLPTPDEPVDATEIMQHIREQDARYDVRAVSFDPRFFDVPAKMLFDEGIPMVEIPQSVERMTVVIGDMYAAVMGGTISHDGDEPFTRQVMNAQARYNDRGFTLAKGRSHGRIDGCIAASLGYDRVNRQEEAEPEGEAFAFLGRSR
jgi:phage terminase large subunit-like protein